MMNVLVRKLGWLTVVTQLVAFGWSHAAQAAGAVPISRLQLARALREHIESFGPIQDSWVRQIGDHRLPSTVRGAAMGAGPGAGRALIEDGLEYVPGYEHQVPCHTASILLGVHAGMTQGQLWLHSKVYTIDDGKEVPVLHLAANPSGRTFDWKYLNVKDTTEVKVPLTLILTALEPEAFPGLPQHIVTEHGSSDGSNWGDRQSHLASGPNAGAEFLRRLRGPNALLEAARELGLHRLNRPEYERVSREDEASFAKMDADLVGALTETVQRLTARDDPFRVAFDGTFGKIVLPEVEAPRW